MTLAQALQQAARILSINGIEDCHIEARLLLGYVTKLSTAQIYAYREQSLTEEQEKTLREFVERRISREPTAYIVNRKEFYGLDLYVDRRVLIPRPETEILVDTALQFARRRSLGSPFQEQSVLIADVGTGCGAIAICLARNLPQSRVYAIDISSEALEVAALNCQRHKVSQRIILLCGHLLQPVPEPVDIVVANLPYVSTSAFSNLSPEITKFEPRIALDGGGDGLELIDQLLRQVSNKVNPRGCLLLEIGQEQEKGVVSLINHHFNGVRFELIPDLSGIGRVAKIIF